MTKKSFNPFPGLRPFQKNESRLFFGRENHIREILRKLDAYRFVSIVGNSGSGKSSLVRAGILPQIEIKDGGSWTLCIMRPGKNPVEELRDALFENSVFGGTVHDGRVRKESLELLTRSRLSLVQVVRNHLPPGKKLLILVDQFEELFRFNSVKQEAGDMDAPHFVDLLLGAVGQHDVPIYVIITVRSDFLGDCEQFTGLPEAINEGQFLIPRMNRDELQRSITGPVDHVQGKISPRLVQQLLKEVGNSPDQLPVLQHVLMRTWEVWEDQDTPEKPIDIEEYEKTGGMDKALSNHAEEAFDELGSERRKKLAEAIFKTITLKGADNRGIRRPTPLHRIAEITGSSREEIAEIANVFRRADRGFIMPPGNVELRDNSVLDISHESLMRVWERLSRWVNEEAESAEIYKRICESALLYDKNMAGLWRDPDLQIAVDWRNDNHPNAAWAMQYDGHYELAMRFIDMSMQDKKFRIAEKTRRTRLTRAAVLFFLITLSALTLWAYNERNQSAQNATLAISEKQKAEQQEALANQQKKVAEENFIKAEQEKGRAEDAKTGAEQQRRIAVENANEAQLQKMKAERASLSANEAQKAAELEKQIAVLQKRISDSLKTIAIQSEENAYRLRILSIAQNLAIKSTQAQQGTYAEGVKALLALQAYRFNKRSKGKEFDPEIFTAMFSAYRPLQEKQEYVHNHHSFDVKTLCFSPDGKTLASSGTDGTLVLCETADLRSKKVFVKQPFFIENIQFNRKGDRVAASADKGILVYEAGDPALKPKLIQGLHNEKISALVWYGTQLITASLDMNIRVIDESASKVIKTYSLESKPLSIDISEDHTLLVIGCENGSLYSLEPGYGSGVKLLRKITGARITSLDINTRGNNVACGTDDGKLFIVSLADPSKVPVSITAHTSGVTSVKFNPDGTFLASASLDNSVKLWNTEVTDEQPVVFDEHDSWVYAIAFSTDGTMLASGGRDKSVRTYIVSQEKLVPRIESKVKRNFSAAEWTRFVGGDIPYEKTILDR